MISTLGNAKNEPKGDFLLVNGKTFEVVGTWPAPDSDKPRFNYDFWYQPRRNVMISTEWGSPKHIKGGLEASHVLKGGHKQTHLQFPEHSITCYLHSMVVPAALNGQRFCTTKLHYSTHPANVLDFNAHDLDPSGEVYSVSNWKMPLKILILDGIYGSDIHVWDWEKHLMKQTIKLGFADGVTPFEIRFLHNPASTHGFVGSAFGSTLYHFYMPEGSDKFMAEQVVKIPGKNLKDWMLPKVPALLSDIIISMDDKYLYMSCWLHGEVRQYDISKPNSPKLVGQIFIGGYGPANLEGEDETCGNRIRELNGKVIDGGPQMLQLSLDGKRLYVTTSLFSIFDKQFYPNLLKTGSKMLQINCNTECGGLMLNEKFLVDFGEMDDGPFLAHEMRYPGGDCTSDIWL
ncbi:unnamed protein product [Enterobius vermicularis]|uniref:Methanethiol oxidase n=1 Tax=Enterobius vermicularis TaxID=51028 RepID=A0A0N4VB55_ENTVE|nr:unnamed protein product [Enterobius vermicularis]